MSKEARIRPNAVTQLAAAFDRLAPDRKHDIFSHAHVAHWLDKPPHDMVDERPVARLHQSVREILPPREARLLLQEAGFRTADYILAHRIPRLFRALLPLLPTSISARLLLRAITHHSWTFAGSGTFSGCMSVGLVVQLDDNPLCRSEGCTDPVCHWHAAVFTGLFARLVTPQARCLEFTCCAAGDDACRFVIDWPRTQTWIQIKACLLRAVPFWPHATRSTSASKDQSLAP